LMRWLSKMQSLNLIEIMLETLEVSETMQNTGH
jgi:hypothetical protein